MQLRLKLLNSKQLLKRTNMMKKSSKENQHQQSEGGQASWGKLHHNTLNIQLFLTGR